MTNFLSLPWFTRGRLLRRSKEVVTILARHGLGWLVEQAGLGHMLPFERGRWATQCARRLILRPSIFEWPSESWGQLLSS